jgi:signal transduction histidine kinase
LTVDSLRATYSVVLLNRAFEIKNVKNLALAMVKIGTLALLFCVLLSILLSNWAVKPTKIAFDKQNRFISDAAHELKTPLTVITANIDTAVSNPESTIGEQRKWLACVQNESMRMANLVNELLMIARTDNNVKQLKEKFDLSRAVEDICIGLEVVVFENKKELITDIQKDIFYNGNENAIKQLLTILIDNAMKYSTAGSIITVNLAKNSKKCRIVVHNTGSEIPKDDLKHIFERFYRVDKSRTKSTGGVGLGLNIAKNIVAEHNGTISCKSGNNTTAFVIIL